MYICLRTILINATYRNIIMRKYIYALAFIAAFPFHHASADLNQDADEAQPSHFLTRWIPTDSANMYPAQDYGRKRSQLYLTNSGACIQTYFINGHTSYYNPFEPPVPGTLQNFKTAENLRYQQSDISYLDGLWILNDKANTLATQPPFNSSTCKGHLTLNANGTFTFTPVSNQMQWNNYPFGHSVWNASDETVPHSDEEAYIAPVYGHEDVLKWENLPGY